jgi:hypothetical protein
VIAFNKMAATTLSKQLKQRPFSQSHKAGAWGEKFFFFGKQRRKGVKMERNV